MRLLMSHKLLIQPQQWSVTVEALVANWTTRTAIEQMTSIQTTDV
jgi:hypothetical protein